MTLKEQLHPHANAGGADFPALLVPVRPAFQALGVGPTKGYQLVAGGQLTLVKIGSKSLITAQSLRRFVASLPPARPSTER